MKYEHGHCGWGGVQELLDSVILRYSTHCCCFILPAFPYQSGGIQATAASTFFKPPPSLTHPNQPTGYHHPRVRPCPTVYLRVRLGRIETGTSTRLEEDAEWRDPPGSLFTISSSVGGLESSKLHRTGYALRSTW